jgi:hypothetical protein
MRILLSIGVAASTAFLTLFALEAQAAGTVQVRFVQPDKFSDVRDGHLRAEDNLQMLQRHLEEIGARYVTDGQTLKIEVLDVDLAGEVHRGGRLDDVRVLKGRADWPRIQLRYTLETPGAPARSREATVSDFAYLERTPTQPNEPLAYERRMLDEWFRAEFKR